MTLLLLFRLRHLNVLVLHPEISSSVSRLIRQEIVRILPNLPFLEALDIFLRDTIESPLDLFSQVPSQLPRLRTLGIVNSDYDTETATCLFCAAPNLVTLEYYLLQDIIESSHARLYWAKWAYLMASLKAVSKTFKSLTISTMGSDRDHPLKILQPSDFEYNAWEMQGLLSSLNSLDVLERLDVPIFALLGPRPNFSTNKLGDILPSSLRELCIRDDLNYGKAFNWDPRLSLDEFWHSHDILEQLRDYLPNRSHNIQGKYPAPSLRKLSLRTRLATSWSNDDLATLRDICRGAGVMCTVLERLDEEDYCDNGRYCGACTPGDEPESDWTEKRCYYVKEVFIYDPSDSTPMPKDSGLEYKSWVFHQPGRVVPYRG
ncbi:hypothetical protein FQN52_003548 [Onygenales sp. PD_12]|nr:hypothetical protein FQN52_003548 [Onygenales sp. PD_12]